MNDTAIITAIKHFAVHDGDGIRTTVFFKGCGLKCLWCHNPESISFKPQKAFFAEKCKKCGNCESGCPNGAIKLYGRAMSLEEVFNEVMEDEAFYKTSGGGVTLSGGECLYYSGFCKALLKMLKEKGINTAVDTSGFVPEGAIEAVMPYTDTFLFDLKAATPSVHQRLTGQDNSVIIKNLLYLDANGANIEIRIPYVPGCNDGEITGIGNIISSLKNVKMVKVLRYHPYARSRYEALGMEDTLPLTVPEQSVIEAATAELKRLLPALEII